jgi:hypothetical protein
MYRYSESIDVVKYAQAIFCKASNAVKSPKTIEFEVAHENKDTDNFRHGNKANG